MKKLLSLLLIAMLTAAGFISCSSDNHADVFYDIERELELNEFSDDYTELIEVLDSYTSTSERPTKEKDARDLWKKLTGEMDKVQHRPFKEGHYLKISLVRYLVVGESYEKDVVLLEKTYK